MLRLIILSILLLTYLCGMGQPTRDQHPLSQIMASTSVYVMEKHDPETIVKGSTYYSENFQPGWILLKNGSDTTQNIDLRYNLYHNILEWKVSEYEIKNLLIDRVQSFGLGDELFINSQRFESDHEGFLKNIYDSDPISIYVKKSIKRKDIKANPPFEDKDSILFYESLESFVSYQNKLYSINTKKELENLLIEWGVKSVKYKKSDLQDEDFLSSLGVKLEKHLNN